MGEWPKIIYSNARRDYALWLRQCGYNFREIGERLGISPAGAASIVKSRELENNTH